MAGPEPAVVARSIQRTLRVLMIVTVVLSVGLIGITIKTYSDGSTNRRALCALRADLEKRVESSQAFLVEHPNGIPGIPARQIVDGIKNQQRTIKALKIVDCSL